jgi:hypothetical protein
LDFATSAQQPSLIAPVEKSTHQALFVPAKVVEDQYGAESVLGKSVAEMAGFAAV